MSYFDDYIADGLCCNVCGAYIDGEEPGYPRTCEDCLEEEKQQLSGIDKVNWLKDIQNIYPDEELQKRRTNFYIQFFKSIDSWEE